VSQNVRFAIVPNSGKISFDQLHSVKLFISFLSTTISPNFLLIIFNYPAASQLLLIVLFQQFYVSRCPTAYSKLSLIRNKVFPTTKVAPTHKTKFLTSLALLPCLKQSFSHYQSCFYFQDKVLISFQQQSNSTVSIYRIIIIKPGVLFSSFFAGTTPTYQDQEELVRATVSINQSLHRCLPVPCFKTSPLHCRSRTDWV
jgi:hypothetical protein